MTRSIARVPAWLAALGALLGTTKAALVTLAAAGVALLLAAR